MSKDAQIWRSRGQDICILRPQHGLSSKTTKSYNFHNATPQKSIQFNSFNTFYHQNPKPLLSIHNIKSQAEAEINLVMSSMTSWHPWRHQGYILSNTAQSTPSTKPTFTSVNISQLNFQKIDHIMKQSDIVILIYTYLDMGFYFKLPTLSNRC